MSPHVRTVLRDLGVTLHVPGLMALASIPVAAWAGERGHLLPFAITAIVALGPGQALWWRFRDAEPMRLRHAMVTAVLAWLAVHLIGSLPLPRSGSPSWW